jgi:hypothetical protein
MQIREKRVRGPHAGRRQVGIKGVVVGEPWAKRHFVQHGNVWLIVLDPPEESAHAGWSIERSSGVAN